MDPHQLINTAERGGLVTTDIAHRAVRMAARPPAQAISHQDGDRPVQRLAPDAELVIDSSGCIVLITPERRVTVSNVADWSEGLWLAQRFAAMFNAAAEDERREASLEHGRRWWEARRHLYRVLKAFRLMDKAAQDALTEQFLAGYDASDTQLSIGDWAPHWALEHTGDGKQS